MTAGMNRSAHSTLRGFTSPRKVLFGAACLVLVLGLAGQITAPGFTRLSLADPDTGRVVFSGVLHDGGPIRLVWRNSLFDLDVTEGFVTENGSLIQTEVTFADPRGLAPPPVPASDIEDLYHTGGPFSARGMRRAFTQIVYRVGEIGDPKMTIGARAIAFKQEVGFGGRIVLSTSTVSMWQVLLQRD